MKLSVATTLSLGALTIAAPIDSAVPVRVAAVNDAVEEVGSSLQYPHWPRPATSWGPPKPDGWGPRTPGSYGKPPPAAGAGGKNQTKSMSPFEIAKAAFIGARLGAVSVSKQTGVSAFIGARVGALKGVSRVLGGFGGAFGQRGFFPRPFGGMGGGMGDMGPPGPIGPMGPMGPMGGMRGMGGMGGMGMGNGMGGGMPDMGMGGQGMGNGMGGQGMGGGWAPRPGGYGSGNGYGMRGFGGYRREQALEPEAPEPFAPAQDQAPQYAGSDTVEAAADVQDPQNLPAMQQFAAKQAPFDMQAADAEISRALAEAGADAQPEGGESPAVDEPAAAPVSDSA